MQAIAHLLSQQDAYPQRSEVWYRVRRRIVTASEVATVTGQNPFQRPETLVLEKLGLVPGFQGNEATAHGQKYEDEAVERYETLTGSTVVLFGLLLHPTLDFLGGSPDGIRQDGIAIEVKVRLSNTSSPASPWPGHKPSGGRGRGSVHGSGRVAVRVRPVRQVVRLVPGDRKSVV